MAIKTIKDLENAVSSLPSGGEIHINTISLTHDAEIRLMHYIQDGILLPDRAKLKFLCNSNEDSIELAMDGKIVLPNMRYVKASSKQDIADGVEKVFTPIIEHLEARNLEQQQKIDELETELQQYRAYVADLITTIQKTSAKILVQT